MKTKTAGTAIYRLSSLLTDYFPVSGSHILNLAAMAVLGNPYNVHYRTKRDIAGLRRVRGFDRILVIGDSNIGDAVILQAVVTALRDYFDAAEIDYAISQTAYDLIRCNAEIFTVVPAYAGSRFLTGQDIQNLEQIIYSRNYDAIFNFCPFIKEIQDSPKRQRIISFLPIAGKCLQGEKKPGTTTHVAWQTYHYIHDLFSFWLKPCRKTEFSGIYITLSDRAIQHARDFMRQRNLSPAGPLIFYNPDASAPFSRIPSDMQVSMLTQLTELPYKIMMASGYCEENIEVSLLNALPQTKRDKIDVVPKSMPIDAYASLIDFSDVYITADGGAMHIAAARKVAESNGHRFRNKTAVFSIFGASSARMYGYDSERPGFYPANQDVPSRAYSAGSPCRNYTCINKLEKTCREVRCFEVLDTKKIVEDVREHLNLVIGSASGIQVK